MTPLTTPSPASRRRIAWAATAAALVLTLGVLPVAPPPAADAPVGARAALASDNLVANGGFESPRTAAAWENVLPGSTRLTGWRIERDVDLVASYWKAAEGTQSIDVGGWNAGSLYQDVPVVSGQRYQLRFALSGNPNGPPAVKSLAVAWGGVVIAEPTFDITGRTGQQMGWRYLEYPVVAAAPVMRLQFTATTTGAFGPAIDDVSLTVPEPDRSTVQPVTPSGGDVDAAGGAATPGGVTVRFPPDALAATATVKLAVSDAPPPGVTASGATLLPKTIDVETDPPRSLLRPVLLRVSLTAAELGTRDLSDIRGGVVVGTSVEPRPTRVTDAAGRTLEITVDHFTKFTLFAGRIPGPTGTLPAAEAVLAGFTETLRWSNPPGTQQVELQLAPFNGDGPGVHVVRNAETSFLLPAPPEWFGLLPDMTYFWRIRTTSTAAPPNDSDWSPWAASSFSTPKLAGGILTPLAPVDKGTVAGLAPSLQWRSARPDVFYYELQLSKDPSFNTNPATATAMVYGALVHGGATNPPNSYAVPPGFPLEANTTYHWRVRPRVQGNGAALAWPTAWSFTTP